MLAASRMESGLIPGNGWSGSVPQGSTERYETRRQHHDQAASFLVRERLALASVKRGGLMVEGTCTQ